MSAPEPARDGDESRVDEESEPATAGLERGDRSSEGLSASSGRKRPRALLRLALRLVGLALVIVVIAPLVALHVATSERGRALIREMALDAGLALDYSRLVLEPLDGHMVVEDLRFASPEAFASVAPHWLRIERVDLRWSNEALLAGRLHLKRILVEGVHLHVVVDEEGNDSVTRALSALLAAEEDEVPTPLSHTLEALSLPRPLRVDALEVRRVRAELTELLAQGERRHSEIDGLELSAWLRHEQTPLEAEILLASPADTRRTRVVLGGAEGEETRTLTLGLSHRLRVRDTGLVTLGVEDTLTWPTQGEDAAPSDIALELELALRFLPARALTRLSVDRFSFAGDVARGALALSLRDDEVLPRVEGGDATLDVDALVALLPGLFDGLVTEGARATLHARPVEGDEGGGRVRVELRAEATRGSFRTSEGTLRVDAPTLALDAIADEGGARLDGTLSAESIDASDGASRVGIAGVRVTIAMPRSDGTSFAPSLRAELGEVSASLASVARVRARDVELRGDGRFAGEGPLDATMSARVASLHAVSGGSVLRLRDTRVALGLADAELDAEDALASRARLSLDARVAHVALSDGDTRVSVPSLGVTFSGRHRGHEPSSYTGALALGGVRLAQMEEEDARQVVGAGRLRFSLTGARLDAEEPLRSRGALHAEGGFAPFVVDLDGRLDGGDATLALHLHADTLASVLETLGAETLEGIELERTGFDLRLRGGFERLLSSAPRLDQRVEVILTDAGARAQGFSVGSPRASLVLTHRGEGRAHRGTLLLEAQRPTLNGHVFDEALSSRIELSFDTSELRARFEGSIAGPVELEGRVEGSVFVEPGGRVRHEERLSLSRLGLLGAALTPAQRALHPVDLGALTVEVRGEGLVENALRPDLSGLAEDWDVRSRVEQVLRSTLRGLRYTPEGLRVDVPEVTLELEHVHDAERARTQLGLRLPRVEIEDVGHHHVTLHELAQDVHVFVEGELAEGRIRFETEGGIARVEQDIWAAYPIEEVSLSTRYVMDGFDSLSLERCVLTNARGGTTLELTKSLGRSRARGRDGRRIRGAQHLSLRGRLVQRLERVDGAQESFRARGLLTVPFSVDSADGTLFRVHATLRFEDVDIELPEAGLHVEGLHASIPAEEAVEWDPDVGLIVVPSTDRNPFARVRFQDVQPLVGDDGHFEIARLRYGRLDAGPIVGNMRVERNVFAIDAVRIERDEAVIVGQLVVDYVPGAERIAFRGNVTGLRTQGSDDPLDANAAIVFDPNRLELDGRLQIVRISRLHLRQLLDLVDPYGEDGSLNSLRSALRFGYPKRVGMRFSQGLMSMNVDLGGAIGWMIRIGEIRGVALGPFMTRHVAPLMPAAGEASGSPPSDE